MVSDRSLEVLRVIVQDYVASREPVGSKTIVDRHSFGVSAATIRNDMALLEEEELIAAPHTSSGRIPTDKGYRVFVDQLADLRPLSRGAAPGDRDVPRRVWRPRRGPRPHRAAALPAHQPGRPRAVPLASRVPACGTSSSCRSTDPHPLRPHHRHRPGRAAGVDLPHARRRASSSPTCAPASTTLVGRPSMADAAARSRARSRPISTARHAGRRAHPRGDLAEQIGANRHDKLVMAGAANLVRTEHDFSGSIYPGARSHRGAGRAPAPVRRDGHRPARRLGQHRPGERVVRPRRDLAC